MRSKSTNNQIARALLADLNNGKTMSSVTQSLAAYLIEENQLGSLGAILRDVERQLLRSEHKLYVRVESAHELSDETIGTIKKTFAGTTDAKHIIIEMTINPDVIGGVRCETAQQRLDLTVRRQLQRLKGVNA